MDILFFLATTCFMVYRIRSVKDAGTDISLRQSLQDGTSLDAQERVCTVSPDNIPTKTGHLRQEMRLQNLWHRATYILVRHLDDTGDNDNIPRFIVQKRSMLKDYYPGRLDPTPGGVVGFGESYQENAIREIEEEMGIDVSPASAEKKNSIQSILQFSYEDDRVRVWGQLYEAVYHGSIANLKLQEEEVQEILSVPMDDLQRQIEESPENFLPDSLHAIQLYFAHQKTKR